MNTILGLPDFAAFKAAGATRTSHRRRILHTFPNGGSPLTGILSMIKAEPVDSVEHTWYEKRYIPARAAYRGTNAITSTAPTNGDDDDGTNMSNSTKGITVDHYIKVANVGRLSPGDIIQLTSANVNFRITAVVRGVADVNLKGYIKCRPIRAYTADGSEDASGEIIVIGSAHGEGSAGGVKPSGVRLPRPVTNQTNISRTAFRFSGTVLQQGLEFDKTGPYKEEARDKVIDHMVGIEMNVIFSKRSTTLASSLVSGEDDEMVRTQSGILEFLELWDAGSTGLPIDGVTYAPYNFHVAATTDAADNKRIIENTAGTMSRKLWNTYAERVGRYHTNKTNEKLVLCGSGAIDVMADMFNRETAMRVDVGQTAYGLSFDTLHTPHGKFHFVSHPLFNENPLWRNWALILDIHSIKFRPLRNRDTKCLKNRQNNDADFRKDEYLTEFMIEVHNVENNMLIKNISSYSAS